MFLSRDPADIGHNYGYDYGSGYDDYYGENTTEGSGNLTGSGYEYQHEVHEDAVADECAYFDVPDEWRRFLYTNFICLYLLPILVRKHPFLPLQYFSV